MTTVPPGRVFAAPAPARRVRRARWPAVLALLASACGEAPPGADPDAATEDALALEPDGTGAEDGALPPPDDAGPTGPRGADGGAMPGGEVTPIDAGGACPMTGIDPTALPSCCTMGAARCVPSAFVPAGQRSNLSSCAGGYCVPDAIIRGGTSYAPPRCTSLGGADGVCVSLCIPMVAMNMALLPRASCAADERCAPCINPLTMMPTGACSSGSPPATPPPGACPDGGSAPPSDASAPAPDVARGDAASGDAAQPPADGSGGAECPHRGPPVIDPATFPPCCATGGAHCVPAALVPAEQRARLATCGGGGACTPDTFIASGGRFIPPTCTSHGGAEGRCLSTCIPAVALQATSLPQVTCRANERCVPCFDPFTGMSTGACNNSCDPGPTRPPVRFGPCCSGRATCIPSTAVPTAQHASLERRDCREGSLCVPNENLDRSYRPPRCSAVARLTGMPYTGVCASTCVRLGFLGTLTLVRGSCSADRVCVPCVNPLTGRPTGAPGCT